MMTMNAPSATRTQPTAKATPVAQPLPAVQPLAIAVPMTAAEWAARIVHRHPALAEPVAKALALAEAGHVSGNDIHCMVINAERTVLYSLDYHDTTGVWSCNCPAYIHRPYKVGRTAYCKHTLARAIAARAGLVKES